MIDDKVRAGPESEGDMAVTTWERAQGQGSEGDFTAALRSAVEHMRAISDADIVALYPYDEETEAFYAPVALGLPEDDLVRALPDMADQLRRFQADRVEAKIPDELLPAHYGPNAWLLATRRPLVSADAAREVDSSFIRRHKIRALIGLPLLVAGHL